ncbi:MAG: hypothetical protein LBV42_02785, partial [Methanobrevibacter sp.]|nr:hypothetical protein [Methanobrevibacter sp.]
ETRELSKVNTAKLTINQMRHKFHTELKRGMIVKISKNTDGIPYKYFIINQSYDYEMDELECDLVGYESFIYEVFSFFLNDTGNYPYLQSDTVRQQRNPFLINNIIERIRETGVDIDIKTNGYSPEDALVLFGVKTFEDIEKTGLDKGFFSKWEYQDGKLIYHFFKNYPIDAQDWGKIDMLFDTNSITYKVDESKAVFAITPTWDISQDEEHKNYTYDTIMAYFQAAYNVGQTANDKYYINNDDHQLHWMISNRYCPFYKPINTLQVINTDYGYLDGFENPNYSFNMYNINGKYYNRDSTNTTSITALQQDGTSDYGPIYETRPSEVYFSMVDHLISSFKNSVSVEIHNVPNPEDFKLGDKISFKDNFLNATYSLRVCKTIKDLHNTSKSELQCDVIVSGGFQK